MGLFSDIVRKVLLEAEGKNIISYDSLKNDYVNGPFYVFHMTGESCLKGGILKSGWESFFNEWNSYGPGIYACVYPSFDPRARVLDAGIGSKPNPNRDAERQYIYGGAKSLYSSVKKKAVMLLCKTLRPHPLKNFLIFDEAMAKTIYGENWRIADQLKQIFGRHFYSAIKGCYPLKSLLDYSLECDKYFEISSKHGNIANTENEKPYSNRLLKIYDKMYYRGNGASLADNACSFNVNVNKAIKGLVFHGPGDGFVIIFRDYNAIEPVGVSYDLGRTFTPIETEAEFDNYQRNNVDIRSALGVDRYFSPTTNTIKEDYVNYEIPFHYIGSTFFGDYALVGRMKKPSFVNQLTKDGRKISVAKLTDETLGNWLWNYIYKPWISSQSYDGMLVSKNIWFDRVASSRWDGNMSSVLKDGDVYTIVNNDGKFLLVDGDNDVLGDLRTLTDKDLSDAKKEKEYVAAQRATVDGNKDVQIANKQPNDNNEKSSTNRTFKRRVFKRRRDS